MTIISGALSVKPDGERVVLYPAGTAFEIAGRSGFDVRAATAAYLCSFCRQGSLPVPPRKRFQGRQP